MHIKFRSVATNNICNFSLLKNVCLPFLGRRRRWRWLLFTHHLTPSFPVCTQQWIQIRGALWQGFLHLFCLIAVKRPPVASGPLLRRDKRLVEEGKQENSDYFHHDPLPLMWAYNMEGFWDLKTIIEIQNNNKKNDVFLQPSVAIRKVFFFFAQRESWNLLHSVECVITIQSPLEEREEI